MSSNLTSPERKLDAQWLDSLVRTFTAATLALILSTSVCVLAVRNPDKALSGAGAAIFAMAAAAVGFYFAGHVAQNTAAMEEARQVKATDSAEASAVRAEQASVPIVAAAAAFVPAADPTEDPPLQ